MTENGFQRANFRVDTAQVRLYLLREPAKTRGAQQLIRTLCDEIDRLRAAMYEKEALAHKDASR